MPIFLANCEKRFHSFYHPHRNKEKIAKVYKNVYPTNINHGLNYGCLNKNFQIEFLHEKNSIPKYSIHCYIYFYTR